MILGLAAMAAAVALSLTYPNLPSLESLTDYRPKVPLRVYTADGFLLGEFGEERRAVVSIQGVPVIMKQAILAAEYERFYQHGGVDTQGVLRALYANWFAAGSEAYAVALLVYQYAKIHHVTSGALDGSLDDLGRRFARKVSKSAPAA